MDIRSQAALLAAIVSLALAGAALLRSGRPRVFTLFALLSLDLFLYSAAEFLHRWPQASFGHATWERVAVASAALLPAASLAFFLEFLGVARRPARRARNLMLAGSLSGLGVAASPLIRSNVAKFAVTVYVVAGLGAVFSVLWRKLLAAPTRVERARLLYLVVGAVVAVLFAALDLLPRFGIPYPLDGL
ncbi:MAG TPA: histidine kinase, partial [Anaeromyxobacteraceae bacterium]|nr:histidine kinase [Anaeromyxobacteraceae bacterium]